MSTIPILGTFLCKIWIDGDGIVFQSPTGKRVRVQAPPVPVHLGHYPNAEAKDFNNWVDLCANIRAAIDERIAWERNEHYILRTLADQRGKQWIADLPEWPRHLHELHSRYPIGKDVVALELTREQMGLVLRISRL